MTAERLAWLRLQAEWGAAHAIAATPIDRTRPASPPQQAPPPAAPLVAPKGLQGLREAIAAFDCPLRATVTRVVLPDGPPDAAVLILGEAPDGDADQAGLPYQGAAGAALAAWLGSVGVRRDATLVMAALPWRPPGARAPSPAEEAQAQPFVAAMLRFAPARRVLILGTLAARMALGGARAGAGLERDGRTLLVLPGVADVARKPAQKRIVWNQLRRLRRALDATATNGRPSQ